MRALLWGTVSQLRSGVYVILSICPGDILCSRPPISSLSYPLNVLSWDPKTLPLPLPPHELLSPGYRIPYLWKVKPTITLPHQKNLLSPTDRRPPAGKTLLSHGESPNWVHKDFNAYVSYFCHHVQCFSSHFPPSDALRSNTINKEGRCCQGFQTDTAWIFFFFFSSRLAWWAHHRW